MYLIFWISYNNYIPCSSMSGTSIIKNPKILVGETVRSTAVGTLRISQHSCVVVVRVAWCVVGRATRLQGCRARPRGTLHQSSTHGTLPRRHPSPPWHCPQMRKEAAAGARVLHAHTHTRARRGGSAPTRSTRTSTESSRRRPSNPAYPLAHRGPRSAQLCG